ncbi:MAG: hypothetical protein A3B10_00775 [Candidatus Doudnabacteria bacterium RIFCSPLOWO2_01_FULL_44_21]|uniref:Uncharacterized protein n=1 Tax=Candidatus Doudnabacteria bacterium RIFCSPLOWO2_01_FULL_44_21 TaxID=1817841 RepID=A0A1F5PXK1_9BACT|nr:MAG: hypothetical protein A3B95_00635 [Candidatus Doudnabacteria bacterium RIFCSPHIGHO2_02_FULL_43_13b]OGE94671.1 MAG: hypothetical protein A3B10_00775 [Candidatus Doudnabacteria bacterium RIFCSPLOWO2_01_FULL_44_21]
MITRRPQFFNEVLWVANLETASDLLWAGSNPDALKQLYNFARYDVPTEVAAAEIAASLRNLAALMLVDKYVTNWQTDIEEEFDRGGMTDVEPYLSVVEPALTKAFPGLPLSVKQFLGMARQYVSWYAAQGDLTKA